MAWADSNFFFDLPLLSKPGVSGPPEWPGPFRSAAADRKQ
jgi:hypothetical protein